MIIGIDGSRAFLQQRTGIEEYSYQVIKGLIKEIPSDVQVRLYIQKKKQPVQIDFLLPKNWEVRELWAPRFWTQGRLSLEMLCCPPDTLFIPAHTVPLVHPKNTLVVIHGLEYEITKNSYGFWERLYMRISIRFSIWAAQKIIAVSKNTQKDLVTMYNVPQKKIQVVYEGFDGALQNTEENTAQDNILFIGRLENRKNVPNIIKAFELLKEEQKIPHTLILAGKDGVGALDIKKSIGTSAWKEYIQVLVAFFWGFTPFLHADVRKRRKSQPRSHAQDYNH